MKNSKKWMGVLGIALALFCFTIGEMNVAYAEEETTTSSTEEQAKEEVTVRFIVDGKTVDTRTVEEGTTIGQLPMTPKKMGYTFLGWFQGTVKATTTTTVVNNNLTFTAKWQQNKYKILFKSTGVKDSSTTLDYTKSLNLKGMTRKGYSFQGWSPTKNGKVKYKKNQKISKLTATNNGTVKLYAIWNANKYNVVFRLDFKKDYKKTYTYDKTYKVAKFTHKNYVFKGWSTKKNGKIKYKPNAKIKNLSTGKTLTLYGVWKGVNYKVYYKGVYVSNFTKTYNTAHTLKVPKVYSPYKKFLGWSLTPTGKVKYKPSQKVRMISPKSVLYARWSLPVIRVARNTKWAKIYSATNGKVVRTCHINVGAPGSETPLGTFHILRKVRSDFMPDAYSLYGVKGVEYTSYWTAAGHAIHTASWCYSNGRWYMGREISHGCLNMTRADAKFVYYNCPVGTKVIITRYSN